VLTFPGRDSGIQDRFMKKKLVFCFGLGLLALSSVSAVSQDQKAQKPTQKATATSKSTSFPNCPPTKGCESFKQMWKANDAGIKNAQWVCFIAQFNNKPVDFDAFMILRTGNLFEYAIFDNGIEWNTSWASFEPGASEAIKHWRPLPDDGTKLEAYQTRDELILNKNYEVSGKDAVFNFRMRLSTGRYSAEYKIDKDPSSESGKCLAIPRPLVKTK
jgi:hypothetical protein